MFGTLSLQPGLEESPPNTAKPRKKRHQVARACTWCRTYRIKCDAKSPCANCKVKGRKCTADEGKAEIRTFSSAISEVDRLRARVKELESQLGSLQVEHAPLSKQPPYEFPDVKENDLVLPENLDPLGQHGGNHNYYNWAFALREVQPGSNQAYGSSSIFYFLDKLTAHLDTALSQSTPYASRPAPSVMASSLHKAMTSPDGTINDTDSIEADFTRAEEERLLCLYWKFHHPSYPVLNKDAFTSHYAKLWDSASISRESSPLVDIMLALCMQIDAQPEDARMVVPTLSSKTKMNSSAGRWFFRRCQYFVQDELEQPSITTFQCYTLSVLWLSRSQRKNAAHSYLAAGLRVGVVLGLHVEPCHDLPPAVQDFRRRLWWTLYSMDAQYAMDFGRPIGVNIAQVTSTLPKDDEVALNHSEGCSLSTAFNTHITRLILATRAIYILFHRVCAKVLRENETTELSEDAQGMETCAVWLDKNMKYLRTWIQQLPKRMILSRHDCGVAFSTDRSKIDMTSGSEQHIRLQMIMEVNYHYLAMTLYRPCISFARQRTGGCPMTERHAISCANHAIAITDILEQDFTQTDCLRYWPAVFFWQTSAALSLVGYILAYPRGAVAFTAREIADTAIINIERLALTFTAAPAAANALRSLLHQVDLLSHDTWLGGSQVLCDASTANTATAGNDALFDSAWSSRESDARVVAGDQAQSAPIWPVSTTAEVAMLNDDWLDALLLNLDSVPED
ncbi:fungal-specific transcription factor domain-containing protein [Paraphoma chrysanthemicola]|nr:fungal-specific transcription factor domain-containing protein [Paraphoma chrysanthemicola]